MTGTLRAWAALKIDRRAVVALEYALIAGLLAMAVLTASSALGAGIEAAFTDVAGLL
jgi:Flp pilus assembly pilin Flp